MYFVVSSTTNGGYSDIVPVHEEEKIFVMFMNVIGLVYLGYGLY